MAIPTFATRRRCVASATILLIGGVLTFSRAGAQSQMAAPPSVKTLSLGVSASGVVQKILVPNGAHVDAGQLLLQLDCRPLEMETRMRAAYRDAEQAAYERTRNGPRVEEIAIGVANVEVAQAKQEESLDAYNRLRALTEGISVTRAQLLEGRRDARVTAAQLEDSRKRLALLQAGSRAEDVAESLARRDAAAAEFEFAKARLDQCSLRAPEPGNVDFVATLGQFVSEAVPVTLARLTPDKATQ